MLPVNCAKRSKVLDYLVAAEHEAANCQLIGGAELKSLDAIHVFLTTAISDSVLGYSVRLKSESRLQEVYCPDWIDPRTQHTLPLPDKTITNTMQPPEKGTGSPSIILMGAGLGRTSQPPCSPKPPHDVIKQYMIATHDILTLHSVIIACQFALQIFPVEPTYSDAMP